MQFPNLQRTRLAGVLLSNGNGNDTDDIKASNISISEDWAKDPSRFIFSKDENAGKYAQLLSETIGSDQRL